MGGNIGAVRELKVLIIMVENYVINTYSNEGLDHCSI